MKLFLDANQGETKNGQAFGYIGTNETTEHGADYCGWFFDWPGDRGHIETVAEKEAVLASLTRDETCRHLQHIPYDEASATLESYLEKFYIAESAD